MKLTAVKTAKKPLLFKELGSWRGCDRDVLVPGVNIGVRKLTAVKTGKNIWRINAIMARGGC